MQRSTASILAPQKVFSSCCGEEFFLNRIIGKDGRNYCEEGSGQGSDDASSIDEDLDLAYQVLSLAIKAYEKDKSSGSEMKIGDCYLCLGHVHFECERPEEALDCFKSGLEHKSKNLPAGHRELSELLYMCGVALQALGRYKESLEYTKKAKDNMTKKLEDINDVNTQDEIAQIREELADVDSKVRPSLILSTSIMILNAASDRRS